ncbi:GRP family sugar transporter [Enterococcus hulanensis]|uniref:GRP family sugar transporter n=1 Tax=Enterococcus hulanensis TaxID=2559929 RepID=A0ABU3EV25_9ENTE|nr:GRP family sugar transporter [Enterococcus hulanensis]MDT2598729.1 GRP family sugar transporter [Enterococcus hulanensis]MDT2607767.1 GRP family sugar transporter [Enterococcus hulanensis]MDT2615062.1 GRP family sugar transporter [Enterococcus hulanensis]MDT2626968.1 GRP family sugar transporter [Enterococcus hulanensis]MDT2654132.1 GRP family sugar transporter [Enterococcus hulanensis]
MNILIALIPAIGWGIQPLILKKIGGRPVNEILGTGIGTLLVGLVVYFFFTDQSLSLGTFMLAMASGAFWVIGQTGQYMAFNLLGVSRTMPISTGLQLVGTSLIGMLLFNEWAGTTSRIIGFGAIILLIIGAALTAVTEDSSNKSGLSKGLIILATTSVGYWVYSALPKLVDASGAAIFFPQMLGVFVAALIYVLFKQPTALKSDKSYKAVIVGIIFSISAFAYIFSAQGNGVATAYVITQLNVVISTLGGMFILKEKKTPKELRFTLIGLTLIVVGSIITTFL